MSKTTSPNFTTPSTLSANASGLIAHTYVRVRGDQIGKIDVYNARTPHARVTMTLGTVLMTFWSASAAQGVLEGVSAARATLMHMPPEMAVSAGPYGQPTIAVDWTSRPNYAAIPQSRVTDDQRRTLRWTDVHMGPLTWQILDRAAFHALTSILRDVHRTAIVVCLDGSKHRADPTADDYVPTQQPMQ
ncbi:hypothetical protein [Mycobacterium sp. URHB0021]